MTLPHLSWIISIIQQPYLLYCKFSGAVTGYNPQHFCTNFFRDVVYRSYSSEMAAFDIATFILDNINNTTALQQLQQLITRYFPNLLKLIACHPASLVEEFTELIPAFMTPSTTVEVLPLINKLILMMWFQVLI